MSCGHSLKDCPCEKKEHVGKYDIYIECTQCHHGTRKELDTCCLNPDKIFVNLPRADSKPTKREFCKNCGTTSAVLKMNPYNEYLSLPILEKSFQKELQENRIEKNRKFWEYLENNRKRALETRENEFWDKYDIYLKSKEWKAKRELVFKRDNKLCQSCLSKPATEVHHLTYKHVFNEPLFDLVSICNDCHKNVHEGDRL